jgi:hypothetical protein
MGCCVIGYRMQVALGLTSCSRDDRLMPNGVIDPFRDQAFGNQIFNCKTPFRFTCSISGYYLRTGYKSAESRLFISFFLYQ